jgi:hypothetical protein
MNIDEINQAIKTGDFTVSELDSLHLSLKFARNQLARKNKRELAVGDSVRFEGSRSGLVFGTVAKINRKYVIVRETNPHGANLLAGSNQWRVPAEMLELV